MDQKILDKFGITEEWIEEDAKQYEDGTFELSGDFSPIHYGKPEILKRHEAMVAEKKIRDAYEKGREDGQTSVIQMLERNEVALTPEQMEVLKRESVFAKE